MARTFRDWQRTLGAPEDPVATDTSSEWSAMSLLKAIYGQFEGGAFRAGFVQSETVRTLVALTQAEYDALTPDPETAYFIIEE